MTKLEAMEIVAMLDSAFPNWKLGERTCLLYETMLEPVQFGHAKAAVMELLAGEREFAPPIGVLLKAAAAIAMAEKGTPMLTPEQAWEEVELAIRSVGYYRQPQFSSEIITRAVAALDWRQVCSSENMEATRAHFFRLFNSFQQTAVADHVRATSNGQALTRRDAPQLTAQVCARCNRSKADRDAQGRCLYAIASKLPEAQAEERVTAEQARAVLACHGADDRTGGKRHVLRPDAGQIRVLRDPARRRMRERRRR